IAARSDPSLLSSRLVIFSVLRTVRSSRDSSLGTNDRPRWAGCRCVCWRRRQDALRRSTRLHTFGRDMIGPPTSGEPRWEVPPPSWSAISWIDHRSRRADRTPGEAGPVRDLLGGGHAPAAWILCHWSVVSQLYVFGERLAATVNLPRRALLPPTRTPAVT